MYNHTLLISIVPRETYNLLNWRLFIECLISIYVYIVNKCTLNNLFSSRLVAEFSKVLLIGGMSG